MTGNQDNSILVARIFRDDVVNLKLALRSIRSEDIMLHLIALEMASDVVFHLLVCGTAERPRPEFHNIFDILHGAIAVCSRKRTNVGGISYSLNWSSVS